MFSFLKKKDNIKVTDIVFMKTAAKWHACKQAFMENADTVFIAWFDDTREQLEAFLEEQNTGRMTLILYREANIHYTNGKQVIFLEHYPLHEKEEALYTSLNLKDIKVFSSLDEALFLHFGGDQIVELMEKMGLQENESIQHSMIGMALKNAQQKILEKVTIEQTATSQAEWFKRNISGEK